MNELAASWAALAGPALIQNTVFLALLLLALQILRDAPAAWRHGLACLGLAKLLTPPLFPLPIPQPEQVPEAAGFFTLSWLPGAGAGVETAAATGPDLISILLLLWAAGALFTLLAPLLATARLARRLRGAEPVGETLLAGLGLPAGVSVHRSERIRLPLTLGLFPRRIFVPADWERWSPHRRRLFLRHELAHLTRRDGLLQFAELLAKSLWFFHPLARLLGRRLHEYREMACDDRSLAPERESAPTYARYLVEAAETSLGTSGTVETASALLWRRRTLLKRVDYQMKGGGMLPIAKWKLGGTLGALVLVFLALSWSLPGGEALAGKEREAAAALPAKGIEIVLHKGGKMDMNGESTDLVAFNKHIMGFDRGDDGPLLKIRCDGDLPMSEFYGYTRAFAERGLRKVIYMDELDNGVPHLLPPGGAEDAFKTLDENDRLVLRVNPEGKYLLAGKAMGEKQLVESLIKWQAKNPKLVLVVQSEALTSYQRFIDAMRLVRQADMQRVAVAPPLA